MEKRVTFRAETEDNARKAESLIREMDGNYHVEKVWSQTVHVHCDKDFYKRLQGNKEIAALIGSGGWLESDFEDNAKTTRMNEELANSYCGYDKNGIKW